MEKLMSNRSHYNQGHMGINSLKKENIKHSSHINHLDLDCSYHFFNVGDSLALLQSLPSESVQLVICDPPYNINLATWDLYDSYVDWSSAWLNEIYRVLLPSGNFVIFGGLQFQNELQGGDLLSLVDYIRKNINFILINMIIWNYPNGMSAHRFFANRHEDIFWFAKTKKYYFDLDSVREEYDEDTKKMYLKDKRLRAETVEKGRNPTNVWKINRLNGNSKERVGHPTQKPIELINRLIMSLSYKGAVILDPFAGSGVVSRAAIESNRHSISSDIDPDLIEYFNKHMSQVEEIKTPYKILENMKHFPINQ